MRSYRSSSLVFRIALPCLCAPLLFACNKLRGGASADAGAPAAEDASAPIAADTAAASGAGSASPPLASAQGGAVAVATPTSAGTPAGGVTCKATSGGDKIYAHFDFDTMKGTVDIDGTDTRRFAIRALPQAGTYTLLFTSYRPGDKKPAGEALSSKSTVVRLVSMGAGEQLFFDLDVHPSGLASRTGIPCEKDAAGGASAAVKVSASAKAIDTSDWKSAPAGSTLELRWTVDQTRAKPPMRADDKSADLTKFKVPIDLTLTLNGRRHSVSLATDGARASSPRSCAAASFFYAGINIAFDVKRAEGDRAVVTRTETSESAPTKTEQVYVFDVPKDVHVSQEIVTVAPDGARTSQTCTAPHLP